MTSKSNKIRSKTRKSLNGSKKSLNGSKKSLNNIKKSNPFDILFPVALFGSLFAGGVYLYNRKSPVYQSFKFSPGVKKDIIDETKKDVDLRKIVNDIKKNANDYEVAVINNYVEYPGEIEEGFIEDVIGATGQAKTLEKMLKKESEVLKGALFTGPPGTGKTMLAKAFAKENSMILINVMGIVTGKIGDSVKILMAIFSVAKKISNEGKKCMILVDEIDGSFPKKGSGDSAIVAIISDMNKTLQNIYNNYPYNNVIFIGITNKPYDLEPAVKDRLDLLKFNELTDEQRIELLNRMLNKKDVGLIEKCKNKQIHLSNEVLKKIFKNFLDYSKKQASEDEKLLDKIYNDPTINFKNELMAALSGYNTAREKSVTKLNFLDKFAKIYASLLFKKFLDKFFKDQYYPSKEYYTDKDMEQKYTLNKTASIYDLILFYLEIKDISNRTLQRFIDSIDLDDENNEKIVTGNFFGRRKKRSKKKTVKRRIRRSLKKA